MSIFIHIHQTTQTYQANERQITLSACNVEKMMRNWSSLVGRAICSPKIVLATPCQQRLQPSFVVFFLYMCRFVGIYNQVFFFASCVVVLGYGQSFGHRKFFCILWRRILAKYWDSGVKFFASCGVDGGYCQTFGHCKFFLHPVAKDLGRFLVWSRLILDLASPLPET